MRLRLRRHAQRRAQLRLLLLRRWRAELPADPTHRAARRGCRAGACLRASRPRRRRRCRAARGPAAHRLRRATRVAAPCAAARSAAWLQATPAAEAAQRCPLRPPQWPGAPPSHAAAPATCSPRPTRATWTPRTAARRCLRRCCAAGARRCRACGPRAASQPLRPSRGSPSFWCFRAKRDARKQAACATAAPDSPPWQAAQAARASCGARPAQQQQRSQTRRLHPLRHSLRRRIRPEWPASPRAGSARPASRPWAPCRAAREAERACLAVTWRREAPRSLLLPCCHAAACPAAARGPAPRTPARERAWTAAGARSKACPPMPLCIVTQVKTGGLPPMRL